MSTIFMKAAVGVTEPKYSIGTEVIVLNEEYRNYEQTGVVEKITPVIVNNIPTFSYVISQTPDEDITEGEPFYDMLYHVYENEIIKYFPPPVEGDPEWLFYSEGIDFVMENPTLYLKNCKLLKRRPKTRIKDFSVHYDD